MATDWIDRVTDVVKTAADTRTGWAEILRICRETEPNRLWSALPDVEATRDVQSAFDWLRTQLASADAPSPARCMYLGLDTLNMEGDGGFNVEMGVTSEGDPSKLETDWVWECEWYGQRHLIESLRDLKRIYESPQFESVSSFADYALVLGYSGLVLSEAFEVLKVSTPLLSAWGFHDGDMFFLGRREADGFERICMVF